MDRDAIRYLKTISSELTATFNRVRDLIGNSHWYTDGAHKEALLRTLVERHIPADLIARRGFVLSPLVEGNVSTEQDVLILDTRFTRPLFDEGGVAITPSDSVVGSISVKTSFRKQEVDDALNGLASAASLCRSQLDFAKAPWFGLFFFREPEATTETAVQWFVDAANAGRLAALPAMCAALPDLVITFRYEWREGRPSSTQVQAFRAEGLAPAVFIGNLLQHLATEQNAPDNYIHRIASLCQFDTLTQPRSAQLPCDRP